MDLESTPEENKPKIKQLRKQISDAVRNSIDIMEELKRALGVLDRKGNVLNIHRNALYYHMDRFLRNFSTVFGPDGFVENFDSCKKTFEGMSLIETAMKNYEVPLGQMDPATLLHYLKRLKLMRSYEDFSVIGLEEDLARIPDKRDWLVFVDIHNDSLPPHLRTVIVARPIMHGTALLDANDMLEFMREVEDTHGVKTDTEQMEGRRGFFGRAGDRVRAFVCDKPSPQLFAKYKRMLMRLGFEEKDIILYDGEKPTDEEFSGNS
jgi:hypothetical protein